jgi:hypothetical protein
MPIRLSDLERRSTQRSVRAMALRGQGQTAPGHDLKQRQATQQGLQYRPARTKAYSALSLNRFSGALDAKETSFDTLAGVPVHYDRLDEDGSRYGEKGKQRKFYCTNKLKTTLDSCMTELFSLWNKPKPTIILSAGTIGDGKMAHGEGFAFDLDGFWWGDEVFTMASYPSNRKFYLGINAHLFHHFSQVLSYHYPGHRDHFHVDFNYGDNFRPGSQAQAYFVQAALKYIYGKDIGSSGIESDGVDGDYGKRSREAATQVLADLGIKATALTEAGVWRQFLGATRTRGFA